MSKNDRHMEHRFDSIRRAPETLEADYLHTVLQGGASGVHESVTRSYRILKYAKELLAKGVPGEVVLELIDFLERDPVDPTKPPIIP